MRAIVSFCLAIGTLSSCHQQEDSVLDGSGVVVKQPSLWKTSISDNGELAEVVVEGFVTDQQGRVILGANKSNQRSLLSIKAQNCRNFYPCILIKSHENVDLAGRQT